MATKNKNFKTDNTDTDEINNKYLKSLQAPVIQNPVLKMYMELN